MKSSVWGKERVEHFYLKKDLLRLTKSNEKNRSEKPQTKNVNKAKVLLTSFFFFRSLTSCHNTSLYERLEPISRKTRNFSGQKANFKTKTCWILPQFLAVVLFSFWMQTQNSFRGTKSYRDFRETRPWVRELKQWNCQKISITSSKGCNWTRKTFWVNILRTLSQVPKTIYTSKEF